MRVAVLGATGHVAKCAVHAFAGDASAEFYLFSRSGERLRQEMAEFDGPRTHFIEGYGDFPGGAYDVIFNGIGVWDTPGADPRQIFLITERYDNLILEYQQRHPYSVAIHVSSGAVYGGDYSVPIGRDSRCEINVNHASQGDYYTAAKLNSEIKHRAFSELNIVDIRLFGFFSRYMNVDYSYLLSGIIRSIRNNTPFHAVSEEFYRDYIHPDDFAGLLNGIAGEKHINMAIDVRSSRPVSKSEMLDFFSRRYGLVIEGGTGQAVVSRTGIKPYYYSTRGNGVYVPKRTSMETIESEIKYFL